MNKTINLNLNLSQDEEKNVEIACSEVHLSLSELIAAIMHKISYEKHVNFDFDIDPFYSDSNIKYLEQIDKDVREGKAHFSEHDLIENNKCE